MVASDNIDVSPSTCTIIDADSGISAHVTKWIDESSPQTLCEKLFEGRAFDGVTSLEAEGCCQHRCAIASCRIFFFELTNWQRSGCGRLAAVTAAGFCIRRAFAASLEVFHICSVRSGRIWRFVTVSDFLTSSPAVERGVGRFQY